MKYRLTVDGEVYLGEGSSLKIVNGKPAVSNVEVKSGQVKFTQVNELDDLDDDALKAKCLAATNGLPELTAMFEECFSRFDSDCPCSY